MKVGRLTLLLGGVLVAACAPRGAENVLLVVADDLGTDKLAVYGERRPVPTPVIDQLAQDGLVFHNAYAPPSCSPARAALLTGRHPGRYGLGWRILADQDAFEVPVSEPSLARFAATHGIDTALVGKWHLSAVDSEHGYRHPAAMGFNIHLGSLGNLSSHEGPSEENFDYRHWEKTLSGTPTISRIYATTDTVDDALRLIRHELQEPWVLVVSFNAPHLPVRVPPPELIPSWEGRQPRTRQQRFDAAIEALDTELGRLLDGMPATVRRRTMTMFLGDNGTPPEMVRPPWDPEHAKLTVYETGVNVPLILSGAGVGPRGGHTDALVHLVDVLPTLSKLLLGRDATQGDGVSFAGLLERPGSGRRDVVATQVFGPNGQGDRDFHQRMIRDARWKLVQPAPGVDELYDLSADPRELRPMDLTEPRAQQTRDRLAHALDLSLP